MDNQNLTTQANDSTKRLTIQDLSAETIELSDEALSQIYGGGEDFALPNPRIRCIIFDPDSLRPGISPYDGEPSLASAFIKTLKG
ncbi:hypothetical protein [Microcoleus sp. herbarium2]|uniref:hypothetical protein n=1 Tax=Microcoleus sp. herbarium2 TaxID=3055433 RepID=UPI002FD5835F